MTQHTRADKQGDTTVWLVVILVVIIIGALGLVIWHQLQKTDQTTEHTAPTIMQRDGTEKWRTYTDENGHSGYVKTFTYPAAWHVTSGNELCDSFDFCASPPNLALADSSSIRLTFETAQSGSNVDIDTEAQTIADRDDTRGNVIAAFSALDGLEARQVQFPGNTAVIVVAMRGGYSYLTLKNLGTNDLSTVLKSWRWQ